jgi:uncharacterized protein YlxW (UPF0749 family)
MTDAAAPKKNLPAKAPAKRPAKAPAAKAPVKAPAKAPAKAATKAPAKTPATTAAKTAAKTPAKTVAKPRVPTLTSAQPTVSAPHDEPPEARETPQPQGEPLAGEPTEGPPRRGLGVLWAAGKPRATRAQLLVALLCGLLGFALVTQVRSQAGSGLSSARQSDLVDILDNLSTKSDQLRTEIAGQQNALAKLTGGSNTNQAALEQAQQRASTLQILAGTVAASGPGIDLHIVDPQQGISADVLLETLEELRDAGAEAIEIRGSPAGQRVSSSASASGPAVRLVASSYFTDTPNGHGVLADGIGLTAPYDLLAIGDAHTLATALGIPGGVLDTLAGRKATGTVSQLADVRITALHASTTPQYARPAATASADR